jgi:hypothetical protein
MLSELEPVTLSATEPFSRAAERTRRVLFEQPFNGSKWWVMGFAYFLASLDSGGGGLQLPSLGRGPGGGGRFAEASRWVTEHWGLFAVLGSLALLVLVLAGILFSWLASRGKFVFLDNLVNNRGAIGEPWRRFAQAGNDLFWFKLKWALAGVSILVLAALVGVALGWGNIQARALGVGAVLGILVAALLILPTVLALALLFWLLDDFAVPVMVLRGSGPRQALGLVWQELVRPHTGAVVTYAVLRLLLGAVARGVMLALALCTCCILALPYLSSVAFLPIGVFFRHYGLYFLEQLGPEWQLIPRPPDEPWRRPMVDPRGLPPPG